VGASLPLGASEVVNAVAPLASPEERVFERNTSYWAKALPPAAGPLAADMDADAVVIGRWLYRSALRLLSAKNFTRKTDRSARSERLPQWCVGSQWC
jgi:hypothetical protein